MTSIAFHTQTEGRYDRHRLISWWDQERLASARVIVAGAGALGNEVLKLLALLGVGKVLVVDFDTIAPSNLARTVLFREEDVGRPKAAVAVERVRELNPQVEAWGVQGDLQFDLGLGEYRAANLVFGCLDSVHARWALNRKCLKAGVPWIDGGISDFHGQVTHYSPGAGACYECTFTEATYERFNRRYACPYGLVNRAEHPPVPTTAITTSIVAALQVQEALMLLHGSKEAGLEPGERLTVYLKPYRLTRDRLPENPACLAHDAIPWELPTLYADWDLPIRALMRKAEGEFTGIEAVELDFELVEAFYCPNCERREPVGRPKEKVFQDQATCPDCGELRLPETVSEIGYDDPLSNRLLRELGLPRREILAFRRGEERVYIQVEDEGDEWKWKEKSS